VHLVGAEGIEPPTLSV